MFSHSSRQVCRERQPRKDRARGPAAWWRPISGAFQWIAGFDRDEPIVDERQCRCVASRYIQDCCGLSVRKFVKCRTFDFAEMKQWRSRDEKSFSHTRTWRNGRNRRGCELNDGGRCMASWLSSRDACLRTGVKGAPWRCACCPKALL